MYKKKYSGWLKHADFLILDIIVLQLSFYVAYCIRHGIGNMYADQLYAGMAIVLLLIDIVIGIIFENLHNVMKRGFWIEAIQTSKQVLEVFALFAIYLVTVQSAEQFSRTVLYLTMAFYWILSYVGRILWKTHLKHHNRYAAKRSLIIVTKADRLPILTEQLQGETYAAYQILGITVADPCDMKDTVLVIRPEDMGRVVSNNYERRIANNNYCVIRDISKGMVNDGKARKLEKWCPRLYGHAGLFSTAADMGKFASMMLSGNLLDSQFVNKIGVNHTGKKNEDGTFSQFHGLLCYSKNPVAKNSEVNHWLSGNAFALGGYTGNQLTIDYRNQLYIFMASNRCHNRITSVSGMDIVYEAGMTLEWPDGKRYICNKGYAFDRDESVINPAIELAMKWRFLEWLLGSESKVIRC